MGKLHALLCRGWLNAIHNNISYITVITMSWRQNLWVPNCHGAKKIKRLRQNKSVVKRIDAEISASKRIGVKTNQIRYWRVCRLKNMFICSFWKKLKRKNPLSPFRVIILDLKPTLKKKVQVSVKENYYIWRIWANFKKNIFQVVSKQSLIIGAHTQVCVWKCDVSRQKRTMLYQDAIPVTNTHCRSLHYRNPQTDLHRLL